MAAIKRPTILTWLCALVIVGIIFSFPQILFPAIRGKGDFVPMVYGIIITLRFVSIIGIWHMKKWGVQFFIITFFMNLLFVMLLGLVEPSLYVYTAINVFFIVIFLMHYKKMADNL
jgi:hypothetical protein